MLNIKETADGYRVDLPDGTENITVNAEANNSKVKVSINGERATSKELTVSELQEKAFDIVLADPDTIAIYDYKLIAPDFTHQNRVFFYQMF